MYYMYIFYTWIKARCLLFSKTNFHPLEGNITPTEKKIWPNVIFSLMCALFSYLNSFFQKKVYFQEPSYLGTHTEVCFLHTSCFWILLIKHMLVVNKECTLWRWKQVVYILSKGGNIIGLWCLKTLRDLGKNHLFNNDPGTSIYPHVK